MKKRRLTFLLTALLCLTGNNALAHDIEVANSDGVTIYYTYQNNQTELAVSYRGTSFISYSDEYTGNVVIPASVKHNGTTYPVTSIEDHAFHGCSSLTSITIPSSVTSIGNYAFADCSGLISITIPSSVTTIGNYAFADCSGLISITIPSSVTSIGNFAFSNCSGLTSITIPSSVTSIGEWAFGGCSGLTSITIPSSVTSIGNYAFQNCSGLISITIPSSVTSIGNGAFSSCSSLISITIPSSVTSIGSYTVYGCDALKDIYCMAEELPSAVSEAFDKVIGNITLHVPASVLDIYKSAEPWSGFKKIVAITDEKNYDWTVGTGGDFASINAAMNDSRVKAGDVLQVLTGSRIISQQNITKAVTIQGNGYANQDGGYFSGSLYIDKDNVTLKNLQCYSITLRASNAVIERCKTNYISGTADYDCDDATIRGCLVTSYINGYYTNKAYGWNISNNILVGSGTRTLSYLEDATIDHNAIICYEKTYGDTYAIWDVTNSSFTNNIIIKSMWSQAMPSTVTNSATKFEYNIHSNTGNPSKWGTNKSGYANKESTIFACTGSDNKSDAYYLLAADSPAIGYANDGGDCGPWSGSFPYRLNGISNASQDDGETTTDEQIIEPNDLLALKNIYQAFGGDNWISKKWNFENNGRKQEDFPGVTFDGNGRVTTIDLQDNGLEGECFEVSTPQLSELTSLNLSRNKISGDLGKLVGELSKLSKLDMSYNRLTKTDGVTAFAEDFSSSINVQYQNRVYQSSLPTKAAFTENISTMDAPILTIGQSMNIEVPSLYTYDYKGQTHDINAPFKVREVNAPSLDMAELIYNGTSNYRNGSTYSFSYNGLYLNPQDKRMVLVDEWNGYSRYSAFPVILRYEEGDADMTGETNVLDVQYTLNFILSPNVQSRFNWSAADTYTDMTINVQDIVQTVNIILGLPRHPNYASRMAEDGGESEATDGYVYARQGSIMLTAEHNVAAIDIDLEGVSTSEVALALNRRDFQMIGRNTEWGSRYMIFSPTGKSIPAGTTAQLLRMSGAGEPVSVECSDPDAQPVWLSVGSAPTGIGEAAATPASNGSTYNLSGQRVEKTRKGIYLQQGRKVVVK